MKIIKIFIVTAILIITSQLYGEQNLYITNIEKQNNFICVEFNNSLEANNFEIKHLNDSYLLIVPKYQNKSTKYNYFSFLTRDFKEYFINSVNKNLTTKQEKYTVFYKTNKFNIVNSKVLKATFSVIFNDLFEVNGTIMNGKNGLWVQWPSIKQEDKWKKLFTIKDKELKNKLEKELINKYNNTVNND